MKVYSTFPGCVFHAAGLFQMVYFMLAWRTHIVVFLVLAVYRMGYFMCSVYIGWCVGSEVSDKREMSWLDGLAPDGLSTSWVLGSEPFEISFVHFVQLYCIHSNNLHFLKSGWPDGLSTELGAQNHGQPFRTAMNFILPQDH